MRARLLFIHGVDAGDHFVIDRRELRAGIAEAIESARVNEAFHNPFIDVFRTTESKIGKILKFSVLVAFVDDALYRRLSDAAERAEPEAQSVALNGENCLGFIDVGGQNLDFPSCTRCTWKFPLFYRYGR